MRAAGCSTVKCCSFLMACIAMFVHAYAPLPGGLGGVSPCACPLAAVGSGWQPAVGALQPRGTQCGALRGLARAGPMHAVICAAAALGARERGRSTLVCSAPVARRLAW
jgi:hypothetical protein